MQTATTPDFNDVQGNILRGNRMACARHFALVIGDRAGLGGFIRQLLPRPEQPEATQLSSAVPRAAAGERPAYCLNIGFTWTGLQVAGVAAPVLAAFPQAFREGPAKRAGPLGDTGPSDPAHWIIGAGTSPACHVLVSLFARGPDTLDSHTRQLRKLFRKYSLQETLVHDAAALRSEDPKLRPGDFVHFGYRDGISQPRIEGVHHRPQETQPDALPGDFLLGCDYRNFYGGNFLGDLPPALCNNGTYGAFRILRQDVAGFEDFIQRSGKRWNMDPELIAAKMMGRWRDGTPLALSPGKPDAPRFEGRLNAFDYAPTPAHPDCYDDDQGLRCPIGAHARRLNPRSGVVMGKPQARRIIRRGMAYGPVYVAGTADDGVERGLIGYFICGDLELQFEFIQSNWINSDIATAGLRGSRDPLVGIQPDEGGKFCIRTRDNRDPVVLADLPQLVTTRGGLYCFLPGLGGLRTLAATTAAP